MPPVHDLLGHNHSPPENWRHAFKRLPWAEISRFFSNSLKSIRKKGAFKARYFAGQKSSKNQYFVKILPYRGILQARGQYFHSSRKPGSSDWQKEHFAGVSGMRYPTGSPRPRDTISRRRADLSDVNSYPDPLFMKNIQEFCAEQGVGGSQSRLA